ncbi:hypothetical protein U9M48_020854, partial [Paspalum notatum var. saurae]
MHPWVMADRHRLLWLGGRPLRRCRWPHDHPSLGQLRIGEHRSTPFTLSGLRDRDLVRLDLSNCGFDGQIPHAIRQLTRLVSLDLSTEYWLLGGYHDYTLAQWSPDWVLIEPNLPAFLANLTNLRELYLASADLSDNGARWCSAFANSTPQLQVLSLPSTGLKSPICGSVSTILSLTEVNLQDNELHGRIPESIADIPSLSVLRLARNSLEGWLPTRIFRNKNLTAIDVGYNFRLSGSLPNFSSHSIITDLLVSGTNFSGPIPSSIGNLKFLNNLGLASTYYSQELPSSIGELRSLSTLELTFSDCSLSGELPSSIGNLKNLTGLPFTTVQFQFFWHATSTNLELLYLDSNNFHGIVDLGSFFKLPKLWILSLSNNTLTVLADYEGNSSAITPLVGLYLAACNISKFPSVLRHMHFIQGLDLSHNQIHGAVPHWVWEAWKKMRFLNLSYNNFSGVINHLIDMRAIVFSFNQFKGPIPIPGPSTEVFDCSNNQFSSVPLNFGSQCGDINYFNAHENNLSGKIPPSICALTPLIPDLIDLSYNNLLDRVYNDRLINHCRQLLLSSLLPLFFLQLISCSALTTHKNQTATPAAPTTVPCRPDQASALLRLKRSFSTGGGSACSLASWRAGTDCCGWEGVACAGGRGRVTTLDLGDCGLQSTGGGLHPALFDLTSLTRLDLALNDLFNGSQLPAAGFERLAELTHLNLSNSDFAGAIPDGIRRLSKLVSLDLRNWIYLVEGDKNYILPLGPGRWPVVEPDIGSLIANFSNMRELYLDTVDLSGNGAAWCSAFAKSTPKLQVLSLRNTQLNAPICGSLSSIHSLTKINLEYNKVYGQIPESLADLPNLSVLKLAYNRLEGWFPARIFQNRNLTAVDISYNFKVSGFLPTNFSLDSAITELLCSNTNFSGPIPSSISNLRSLKGLGVAAGGFHQELPSSIGELRSLTTLQVSGAGLIGEMPSWIANLTSLETLQFSNCGVSGQVFNMTQLMIINLHSNSFTGTIELSSFFKLPNLARLNLSKNKLSVVEGEYNTSWESIQNFHSLSLASCNLSKLPGALRQMQLVVVLDLSNNHIHGALPQWAWDNWIDSIILMNISHNQFSGSIGYGSIISANMFVIDISYNLFEGLVPIPGPQTQLFDCSNNRFSSMPSNFGSNLSDISLLMASGNNFSGEIPPSICEATSLMLLDLSNNSFFGSIPSCLMENMSILNVLNLKLNQFHGRLPNNLKQDCAFEALDFSDNQIEGQLPRSLVACKDLEVFDIGNNLVDDTFPCWMSMLPKLQVLVLNSNKFAGNVGQSISGDKTSCQFKKLRIFDLASNNFSGILPIEWFGTMTSMMTEDVNETLVLENQYDDLLGQTYQFTTAITYKGSDIIFSKILRTIVVIDVSDNVLHGSIPESIGDLILLMGVNMSHNAFTGAIPSQLGMLHQLESLDLSSNDLSGDIPQELASLDFLSILNLSYNRLEGRIPESSHFLTFSNLSFLGNMGLCGFQVSKTCNNMTPDVVQDQTQKAPIDIVLFLFAGLGFGIGFAITIVLTWGISRSS